MRDVGAAWLYRLYRRATGVDLFQRGTRLETVALLLYRDILKQLHRREPRPGRRQPRLEEFGYLFHKIRAEPHLGRKEAYLRAMAEALAALRAGAGPPPALHFSALNTDPEFFCEENSLALLRNDTLRAAPYKWTN